MKPYTVSTSQFCGRTLPCVRDEEGDIVAAGCTSNDAALFAAAPALCDALIDLLAVAISRGDKLGLDQGGPVLDKARAALGLALSMD